jgi:hypothetical protein
MDSFDKNGKPPSGYVPRFDDLVGFDEQPGNQISGRCGLYHNQERARRGSRYARRARDVCGSLRVMDRVPAGPPKFQRFHGGAQKPRAGEKSLHGGEDRPLIVSQAKEAQVVNVGKARIVNVIDTRAPTQAEREPDMAGSPRLAQSISEPTGSSSH